MFLSNNILSGFYQANSFIVKDTETAGVDILMKQIDDLIYQYTKIKAPDNADDANRTLQLYACCLFVYLAAGKSEIEDIEMQRREKLYNNAMLHLENIKAGTESILDDEGNDITAQVKGLSVVFSSTKRITGIL